jgi:hypothetical protein
MSGDAGGPHPVTARRAEGANRGRAHGAAVPRRLRRGGPGRGIRHRGRSRLACGDGVLSFGDRRAGGHSHRRAAEIAGRRKPEVGVLGHRAGDDPIEVLRHLRDDGVRGRRGLAHVRVELRDVLGALERQPSGKRREQNAAERVDVAAGVHGAALDLLGRRVVDRPHPPAGGRDPARRVHLPRQAEVREVGVLGAAAGLPDHVAGFTSRCTRPRACASSRAPAI